MIFLQMSTLCGPLSTYVDRGGWHFLHVKIKSFYSQIQFLLKSSPEKFPNTIQLHLLYFNRNVFLEKHSY